MKTIAVLALPVLLFLFSACGGRSGSAADADKKEILIGIAQNPTYANMCRRAIQPILESKGYTVRYREIGDALVTNVSVANGDVDLNVGQHEAYLEFTKRYHPVEVSPLVIIPSAVDGLYSNRLKARNREELLAELKAGDVIVVPYDPANQSRTLCFLEDIGLIKLRDGIIREDAQLADIIDNPIGIVIRPVDSGMIPRMLSEVTAGIISGQEAEYAGIFDRAIVREVNTPPRLQIIYGIKTSNLDAQWARDFVEAVHSEAFRDVIEDPQYSYHRYVKPDWYIQKWGLPDGSAAAP